MAKAEEREIRILYHSSLRRHCRVQTPNPRTSCSEGDWRWPLERHHGFGERGLYLEGWTVAEPRTYSAAMGLGDVPPSWRAQPTIRKCGGQCFKLRTRF